MHYISRFFVLLGICLLSTAPAFASMTQGSSGLVNPTLFYDFGNQLYPNATPITTQFPGVTFNNIRYYTFLPNAFANIVNGGLDPFPFPTANPTVTIQFPQLESAASFALASGPGTTTFELLRGSQVVETDTALTNRTNTSNYFIFSGVSFDTIQITGPGGHAFAIDNLAVVPEPGRLVFIGSLVVAGAVFKRRRSENSYHIDERASETRIG